VRQPEPLQQPPPALPPMTLDRVEAWFDDIQFSPAAAALIEEASVEPPAGQALAGVDDLLEAFERLDSQLEAILDSLQTYNPRP
jgi:hypothetical protein